MEKYIVLIAVIGYRKDARKSLLDENSKRELLCYMEQNSDGRLSFVGRNIKVDYSSLLKNDTVKQEIGDLANQAVKKTLFGGISQIQKVVADGAGFAAEMAAVAAPKEVEKNKNDGRTIL